MITDYRDFCVWVVVACGSVVLTVFAVYFVIVIWRLIVQLLHVPKIEQTQPIKEWVKSGKPLPPRPEVDVGFCPKCTNIATPARVEATDNGPKMIFRCAICSHEFPEP